MCWVMGTEVKRPFVEGLCVHLTLNWARLTTLFNAWCQCRGLQVPLVFLGPLCGLRALRASLRRTPELISLLQMASYNRALLLYWGPVDGEA